MNLTIQPRNWVQWARNLIVIFCILSLTACTTSKVLTSKPTAKKVKAQSSRYAALIMNANTGRVLYQNQAYAIRYPASLTKMMTMYLTFEALKRGRISKATPVPVSARAAAEPASKLYLKAGQSISVNKALEALAVKSANDVAYAMAEFLGGSEARFARIMTRKARALGMSSTTFRNASGLPDKRQVTTARDMAKLGIALRRNFPQYFYYFKKKSFFYKGKSITGHNRVLSKLNGADGIKTGYTRASGFNLVTSARTRKGRIIGVLMGEKSGKIRDNNMVRLIKRYGS